MYDNVVIGVGDLEGGRDALALGRQLVSSERGLTLLQVQVVSRKPSADSGLMRETQEQQRERDVLASLRDEAEVDARVASVKGLSIARGLHAFARLHRADLLVVGASRASEVDRMLIGDDTREVLRDAPCAVAIAPVAYATRLRPMKEIAVAYDGSRDSDGALEIARGLAAEGHATVSAVQVVPMSVAAGDPWNPDAAVAQAVEAAERRVVALGGVEPHVVSGDAAEELERFEPSVDLLVVGAHEHRAIGRFLGPSTSETLAEHPASPLLVLPPSKAAT
jgi:nucleotide-binding universal stress UspA family protein